MRLEDFSELLTEISFEAGNAIMGVYSKKHFGLNLKKDNTPVTEADIKSHNIIVNALKETGIPIISEESAYDSYHVRKKTDRFWLVDPLDGTKEFISRNGEFTINIALIEKNSPMLGLVYAPALGELYTGIVGNVAFKYSVSTDVNGKRFLENKVSLPNNNEKRVYTILASRSHLNEQTLIFIEQVRKEKGKIVQTSIGSSLKFCLIAEGKADLYPRFGPTKEWDTAAGHAIVLAAGGRVYQPDNGEPLKYNKHELTNPYFIAESL